MRVLVLGGAGFLGRHVVAALEARGQGHDRNATRTRRAALAPGTAPRDRRYAVTRFER